LDSVKGPKMNPQIRYTLVAALGLAYLGTLVMSAGHLAAWFDLTRGTLPVWFSLGLAVGLELLAFTLSLASTLEPRLRWAFWGGLFFLALVWVGNLLAMNRVAEMALLEVVLQSLFALGPLVAGKAIGELLRLDHPSSPALPPLRGEGSQIVPPESPSMPIVQTAPTSQTIMVNTTVQTVNQQSKPDHDSPTIEPRALELLEHLSDQPKGASELARLSGIPKTSTLRLVGLLVERGLVGREGAAYVKLEVGHEA
jgi:hypothetical protein